jgi:hypothetical protein
MPASIGFIAIDSVDPDQITPFWCASLGVEMESTVGDGQFVQLSATPNGLTVGFQRVPELEGFQWRCMADPQGNEFDIDVLPAQ